LRDVDRSRVGIDVSARHADPLQPCDRPLKGKGVTGARDPDVSRGTRDRAPSVGDHEKGKPEVARSVLRRPGDESHSLPRGVPQPVERVPLRAAPRCQYAKRESDERNAHASMLVSPVVHPVGGRSKSRDQHEGDQAAHNREMEQASLGHRITSLRRLEADVL